MLVGQLVRMLVSFSFVNLFFHVSITPLIVGMFECWLFLCVRLLVSVLRHHVPVSLSIQSTNHFINTTIYHPFIIISFFVSSIHRHYVFLQYFNVSVLFNISISAIQSFVHSLSLSTLSLNLCIVNLLRCLLLCSLVYLFIISSSDIFH